MLIAALLAASACGESSAPIQVVSAGNTPTPQTRCGISVGYIPVGLKLRSVEGGPDHKNVDIRYTSAQPTIDTQWVYVGAAWGSVIPVEKLHTVYYPTSKLTSVQGHDAILARPGRGDVLLQWNQSSTLTLTVESRGGLSSAEVRRIAANLTVPSSPPADPPGPPEAPPEGCSLRAG